MGDRQSDPERPRADDDPPLDEQPEEGLGARGIRAEGDAAGANSGGCDRRQPAGDVLINSRIAVDWSTTLLIGGVSVEGRGSSRDIVSPSTEKVIATVADATV